MNIIKQKCREADILAARFYKSAAGDRQRAARDWEQKVKEAADLINLYTSDAQKCRKADILAARFYKSAAGDRDRVARDWHNKVKEAVNLVKLYTPDAEKCRKKSTSNKDYLKF